MTNEIMDITFGGEHLLRLERADAAVSVTAFDVVYDLRNHHAAANPAGLDWFVDTLFDIKELGMAAGGQEIIKGACNFPLPPANCRAFEVAGEWGDLRLAQFFPEIGEPGRYHVEAYLPDGECLYLATVTDWPGFFEAVRTAVDAGRAHHELVEDAMHVDLPAPVVELAQALADVGIKNARAVAQAARPARPA